MAAARKKTTRKKTTQRKKSTKKRVAKKSAAKFQDEDEEVDAEELITITAAAKLKGLTGQAVRNMAYEGRILYPARHKSGKLLRNHPNFVEWLATEVGPTALSKRGNKPLVKVSPAEASSRKVRKKMLRDVAQHVHVDLSELAKMPFEEVLQRYGSIDTVYNMSKSLKEIAFAQKAQVQMQEVRGVLVRRDFVRVHIVGALDGVHRRLLNDVSPTVANKLRMAIKADSSPEECRRIVHDLLSATLEQARDDMLKSLAQASGGNVEDAVDAAE